MKRSNGSYPHRRRPRIDAARRTQLLAAFDRSGLSVANFARQQGIHYTTFYGWRQKTRAGLSPDFVQIDLSAKALAKEELPVPAAPVELVIDLGAFARLRLTALEQIPLAARLLQTLDPKSPC